MNILLVEDNDLDVEILKRGLRKVKSDGTLLRVRDGAEALDLLTNPTRTPPLPEPFLILLDINMPRMNGHEFLAALRQTKTIAKARVLVFTTSENPLDIETAYEKHACGYIVKPSGSQDLQSVLKTLNQFWQTCESPTPLFL